MLPDEQPTFTSERIVHSDGTVRILVSGSVDAEASSEFMDVLVGGIALGRTLIVDLGSTTHLDETGVAALALADRIAMQHGSELQVLGCTGEAEHVLGEIKSGLVDADPER